MLVVIGITVHRNGRWGATAMVADPVAAQNEPAPPQQADKPAAKPPAAEAASHDQPATENSVPGDDALVDEPANDPDSMNSDRSVDATPSAPPSPRDDRDPEEATEFRRQAEAIADWGLAIQGIENPAYWRLLEWINRQSLAELKKHDPPAAVFQQLRQHPGKYRGKLLSLELSVRRVVTYDVEKENPAGVKRSTNCGAGLRPGSGWFYVVVTPELPPGFPVEADITQTMRRVRLFFQAARLSAGQRRAECRAAGGADDRRARRLDSTRHADQPGRDGAFLRDPGRGQHAGHGRDRLLDHQRATKETSSPVAGRAMARRLGARRR